MPRYALALLLLIVLAILVVPAKVGSVTGRVASHHRLGRVHHAYSSAYCYGGTTASEHSTRFGYVATYPGKYRLGTYLRLVRPKFITDPVTGRKRSLFRVMDRGYSPLDIWFTPGRGVSERGGCHWGRKWVSYRLAGWRRP
jgi:hypothetical protein